MPIINVTQVGKSFGAELIFSGVSFQIDEHDRIGLVGPNGAGKTTLLDLLARFEEPDEGTISIARNTRIGYLTQHTDFHPQNTLREEMLTVFAKVQEHGAALRAMEEQMANGDHSEELLARYSEAQEGFERRK